MKSYTAHALLLVFSIIVSLGAFAQEADDKDRKIEFSIHLDNIFSDSPGNYSDLSNPYMNNDTNMYISYDQEQYYRPLMAGIGIRYLYSESLSFRAKVSYYGLFSDANNKKDVIVDSTGFSDQEYSYYTKVNNIRLNLGAQKQLGFEKGELYYGGDLVLSYTDAVYKKEILVLPLIRIENPITYRRSNQRLALGVSPYIGVRYHILPRVSISTEMGLFYEYYMTDMGEENWNVLNRKLLESKSENAGHNVYFGPMGHLSVNFLF